MRIGIIGVGTVGGGVVEILEQKQSEYAELFGVKIEIAGIAARTEEELAPFKAKGYATSTDANALIHDPSIQAICELAGGYELPRTWITAALQSGKHIVTANKALIAKYGHELFPLAAEKQCHLFFEAAVGGGIPIIRSLQESLVGNKILSLNCIINGTCNYILTRMSQDGLDFEPALAEAQARGYAEADPTFDVEGIDAGHKTAILAALCSGKHVDFEQMHVSGITKITAQDIAYAKELGYTLKLLGTYRREGERVDARVHPCLVANEHLLASVNNVLNAVYLQCDNLGATLQTGAGAGKLPTASAVVADLVSLARSTEAGRRDPVPMGWFTKSNPASLVPMAETSTRYYFRFTTLDACGVLAKLTGILSQNGISIESILQKNVKDPGKVSIVVCTERTSEAQVVAALSQIDALGEVTEPSRMIRFLE